MVKRVTYEALGGSRCSAHIDEPTKRSSMISESVNHEIFEVNRQ